MDKLLLEIISLGVLISYLSQLKEPPALQTTVGPTLSPYLFVEREEEHNPPAEHDYETSLSYAWESN